MATPTIRGWTISRRSKHQFEDFCLVKKTQNHAVLHKAPTKKTIPGALNIRFLWVASLGWWTPNLYVQKMVAEIHPGSRFQVYNFYPMQGNAPCRSYVKKWCFWKSWEQINPTAAAAAFFVGFWCKFVPKNLLRNSGVVDLAQKIAAKPWWITHIFRFRRCLVASVAVFFSEPVSNRGPNLLQLGDLVR